MASTLYTSVQYRTVTAAHAAAEFPSASQLIASGAVAVDANPPFRGGGGITYNVPHFLEVTGVDVVPTASTDGTRNAISTFKDVGVICEREYGLGVEESARLALGTEESINAELERQAPMYWAKRMNIALYNVLKGAFASAMSSASYFVLDTNAAFSRTAVLDVIKLSSVGDQWPLYRIWIMHSTQFAQALSEGIVTYVNAGAFGERLLVTGDIPTIFGKQVIVDDNIVETDGSSYLLKPGAMYLGFQSDFRVEYQRDASLAGGTDEFWLRAAFMPHLYGLTYAGAAKPTNSTLSTGASWTLSQTTDYKLHKAIKIKFTNA